jgi:hypothetical protein
MDFSKLTDAANAIGRFVETASGSGDKEDQKQVNSPVPGSSPAMQMAKTARESYQKTARWMLAAFAAVGVLIFGSLPFAAIADVEIRWPGSLWLVGGLLVAVAGIVAAVVAVSLVSEPEEVSLGELDCDLRAIQKTDDKGFLWVKSRPVLKVNRLRALWNPRLAARIELANIVHGPESSAHLGPNLEADDRPASVTNLIKRLGDLESEHARLAPTVARHTVSSDAFGNRLTELTTLLSELRKRQSEHPDPTLDKEIGTASAMYAAVAGKLDQEQATLTTEKQKLAEVDDQLRLYQDHRDLILAESGVMHLRGTFRLARRILAIAAVLTLFGGTAYALSLPGATAKPEPAQPQAKAPEPTGQPAYETGLPATVLIHDGTQAAKELPKECIEQPLQAIWVGNNRVPATTGPFTVVVTTEACAGQLTAAAGEGRFTLKR